MKKLRTKRAARLRSSTRATALAAFIAAALAVVFWPVAASGLPTSIRAASVLTAADPNHITFTLEGCRNDGSPAISLPDGNGDFICPDAAYTTGNLGKGWAELDLVPHRATLENGNGDQTYSFIVAGDYKAASGAIGWDFISDLTLNTDLSSATGCSAATMGALTITPSGSGVGGADQTIYRLVTITQAAGSTCVYDYFQRLALGAHSFSGSSLQSNLWNQTLSSSGIGQKRIQLPVTEIEPQSIHKDMTATRNADHVWNLTKGATPTSLNFGNVCDPAFDSTQGVDITVTWTRLAATPSGDVTIVTNVYAHNPAHRTITVNVSDQVYEGSTQTTTVGAPASSGPIDVLGETDVLVLTHSFTASSTATSFNDVATATYTDTVTGLTVPGNTTATASATVGTGTTTNQSATIADSESITTGAALTFAVATPSVGSFSGYTAGTYTTGPVVWNSGTQNGSGAVTFNKTVKLDPAQVTSGTLSDSATLTGSNGASATASASVGISSSVQGSLTVTKTIPNVLQGSETDSFSFTITGPGGYSENRTLNFAAGDTSKSVTLTGLAAGTYNVDETASGSGKWTLLDDQQASIGASSCSPTVTFNNRLVPSSARVRKVTVPAGGEAGWVMTLNGPGTPAGGESVTTTGTGFVAFSTSLQEGSYTITETLKAGYDQTSASSECSFTVVYPADADRTFSCTFTNTRRGHIIVVKQTDPDASPESFEFDPSWSASNFSLSDGQSNDSGALVPGTYSVSELAKTGWDLTSATCDDGSAPGAIGLGAGETVTCTFTNTQRGKAGVVKTVSGAAPSGTQSFTFTLRTGATPIIGHSGLPAIETLVANAANGGVLNFTTYLVPGTTYQLCEEILAGWQSNIGPNPFVPEQFLVDGVTLNPAVDNSPMCVNFTVTAGQTKTFNIDNTPPPGGRALTIGYWKTHGSCSTSNGKNVRGQLDIVLGSFPGGGVLIGDIFVNTCAEAIAILNKSTLAGKKMASDPAYNLAAQLLAYRLNIQAGAGTCSAAVTAATAAQALLDKYNFDATGSYKMSAADQSLANSLANTLDRYNNDLLC